MPRPRLRLGWLINPLAGMGGPLAAKGSDHLAAPINTTATHAPQRAQHFLQALAKLKVDCDWLTLTGDMGENALSAFGFTCTPLDFTPASPSTAADTQQAVQLLVQQGVDLLVFVGGDGTARDVYSALQGVNPQQLVLGVPAGVKMHSGVYAVNPAAAAEVVHLISREVLHMRSAEVRDINEHALQQGQVNSRYYGQMCIPYDARFVQQVKQGGFVTPDSLLQDIADWLQPQLTPNLLCVFGPGGSLAQLESALGLPSTLLGFDVFLANAPLCLDATAEQLNRLVRAHKGPVRVFLTVIGGQGHIFGRGNQQLQPDLIRHLGKNAFCVLATPEKLAALPNRCLFVDTGCPQLDAHWQGLLPVMCGYDEVVLMPVGAGAVAVE